MRTLARLVIAGTLVCGFGFLVAPRPALAQKPPGAKVDDLVARFNKIQWQQGPCKATMRNIGLVEVPKGYKFTGEAGTATIMELTQNLPSSSHLGLLCPASFGTDKPDTEDWFVVYEWEDIGYVKDEDKSLDGNALLESLRKIQENANNQLRAKGLPELTLVGWEQAPFYDPQTKLLTWGTRVRANNGVGESVNYNSRILGRGGVLSVNLVITPESLQQELPKYKDIVKATSFQQGQTYAEWRAGDKVATYGLAALVTGGVAAGLAKSGLLGKLGKFIIYIVVGGVMAISAFFKKIFGRGSTPSSDPASTT